MGLLIKRYLNLAGIAVGFALLSSGAGQATGGRLPSPSSVPGAGVAAWPVLPDVVVPAAHSGLVPVGETRHNVSLRTPLEEQIFWSAKRGAEWLYRMNRRDGRFVPGHLPALGTVLSEDNFLHQAGAALALARAARFTKDQRYAARATQAILLLLEDTVADAADPRVRYPAFPSALVNRVAASGLLIAAINELPAPQADLLEKSEQLCNFIRRQQQADGSLDLTDSANVGQYRANPAAINQFPGIALYGLMCSQLHHPAAWKSLAVRKALSCYAPYWRSNKNATFIYWQSAAYTEAYLERWQPANRRTRDPVFADFVKEMNDWLCELQYNRLDPRQALWYGGFKSWQNGRATETEPGVDSALAAGALVEAYRVAREAGDPQRCRRYAEAVEKCLQFLATLQYTEANTRHFSQEYRPSIMGAYHGSLQDGNVRLDYAQHVICAQIQYLTAVGGGR